jgi:hypothetical protein
MTCRSTPAEDVEAVRITDSRDIDAPGIHLTDTDLEPGRTTFPAELPPGVGGFVVLDQPEPAEIGGAGVER